MKTIKELEALKSLTDGGKGYWQALEEVLGLINKKIKTLKDELIRLGRQCGKVNLNRAWHIGKQIELLEELKKRIIG